MTVAGGRVGCGDRFSRFKARKCATMASPSLPPSRSSTMCSYNAMRSFFLSAPRLLSSISSSEEEALRAMTQAGRAFIGLHPEIAEIKVVSEDSEGGLLHTFWIHSEERQWEIDRAAERYHREQEEREA